MIKDLQQEQTAVNKTLQLGLTRLAKKKTIYSKAKIYIEIKK